MVSADEMGALTALLGQLAGINLQHMNLIASPPPLARRGTGHGACAGGAQAGGLRAD
jgi:hypothetical protein